MGHELKLRTHFTFDPPTPCPAPCPTCLSKERHHDCLKPRYRVPKVPPRSRNPSQCCFTRETKGPTNQSPVSVPNGSSLVLLSLPGTRAGPCGHFSFAAGGRAGFLHRGQQRVPRGQSIRKKPPFGLCPALFSSARARPAAPPASPCVSACARSLGVSGEVRMALGAVASLLGLCQSPSAEK